MAEEIKKKLSKEEFDEKMADLQLREKELSLLDLQERLDERQMKREMKVSKAKGKGATLKQNDLNRRLSQNRCNHRKGGNGADGVVGGRGDDAQYCVLKHKMANGDWWIRCLRCGKWWIPPILEDFESKEGYEGALREYQTALDFPTRNAPSGSIAFQWGDGGKYFRQVMKNTINT